ncbi:MAG: hypothetical protein CFE21_05940 [Bacteroidetes bacterium B1(2017)]|nr:MAG: hypothetical protein CFE21_05940 [Bacteroidetes bacterium B1(2017)]
MVIQTLFLTSITGKEIQQWNTIDLKENQPTSLPISRDLDPGIYFITIKADNGYYTYKLLKK